MVSLRLAAFVAAASSSTSVSAGRIHPNLHRQLQQTRDVVDIVVDFKENHTKRALQSLEDDQSLTRSERISNMIQHLDRTSKETHQEVLNVLVHESDDVEVGEVTRLWITSSLFVKGASHGFIERVSQLDSVSEVRLPVVVPLLVRCEPEIQIEHAVHSFSMDFDELESERPPEWNIEKIKAPQVWKAGFTGQNVIVASIDTGVRATHEMLRDSFVGLREYGWYDPETKAADPYDLNGHGTHTMSIMVGPKGFGVAPGAKWMSCKHFRKDGNYELDALLCAQFVACPHNTQGKNPDCTKAPHVVNNSWNPRINVASFSGVIDAWRKAGIIPVFSMGNYGPACSTIRELADDSSVISVGATAANDSIGIFSSRGPTSVEGLIKPDISAPGVAVLSAVNVTDDSYARLSGTSMAAPHVSGVIALMLSANRKASFQDIKQKLLTGVITQSLVNTKSNCGGINEDVFPNYVYGYGRVNAYQAVFGPTPEPKIHRELCSKIKKKVLCKMTIVCHWTSYDTCESDL